MRTEARQLQLLLLVICLFAITACGQSATTDNSAASFEGGSANEAKAKLVYKQNCVGCHAADLSGRVGPNLQSIGSTLTKAEIYEAISSGREGMPPYDKRLEAEDIDALAAWLAAHTDSKGATE
ncbi:c-type cytochrome [Paenibacillus lentus]|uniref:Cytochrome c n=1 Tax=Paenibacillus lentus TaxID=1338368 RepID=A0A3S8RYX1_9BACL|nr:cytochrome c [Paenibacillus lentus]AZK48120.1 cytochrome c [Paenibacillus lentus]